MPTETETQDIRKTEDGKYILKVGDDEKQVDEKELFRLAQLSHGAGRKFEEASQLRKDAEAAAEAKASERDQAWKDLVSRADAGDAAAYEQVINQTYDDPEVRKAKVDYFKAMWAEAKKQQTGNNGGKRQREAAVAEDEPIPMEKLPEEVQQLVSTLGVEKAARLLDRLDKSFKEEDRNLVYNETWKEVAGNAELAKIVSKGGPRADKLRALSDTLIKSRIRDGEPYGPKLRGEVVKELLGVASEFGSGATSDNPIPHIGLAPSLSHLGPQADKEPERKPISDLGYAESVLQRLAHKIRRGP